MTPTEFQTRLTRTLYYVDSLLCAPQTSRLFEIGRTFALMADNHRIRYITGLVKDNHPGTCEYEIGQDLKVLLTGRPHNKIGVA
ncbi:hypothetical protein AB0C34_17280 [Nocardia sp. NPDC049220]|uniref:hypothetical protein n=1 Tax=Nocardia sp. NPDC049220 TaxID=3155273 RepID=UPI0033C4632E